MSNESSATNWIVGCLVVGVVCLIVCAGGAFLFFRWGVQRQRAMMEEMERAQVERARAEMEMARQTQLTEQPSDWSIPDGWTAPPADAPDDALLPPQAAAWERTSQGTEPEIPLVGSQREARHAVYATDGQSLDVHVCQVSAEDRDVVFDQVEMVLSHSSINYTTVSSIDGETRTLCIQSRDDGQRSIWLVWNGGWLFTFQTDDSRTPIADFMTDYFREIDDGQPADELDNDPDSATEPLPDDAAGCSEAAADTCDVPVLSISRLLRTTIFA